MVAQFPDRRDQGLHRDLPFAPHCKQDAQPALEVHSFAPFEPAALWEYLKAQKRDAFGDRLRVCARREGVEVVFPSAWPKAVVHDLL